MSLPNYLAKIKSAGIYRFVFDDSTVTTQEAETLRMVVGYSEKGPFNTPVYIDNAADFTTIFGNISKRLERRGVYFHRMALQALQAGPILALNLKPFDTESVKNLKFDFGSVGGEFQSSDIDDTVITSLYNTNRFWYLDENNLIDDANYVQIAATDTKDKSCTIFMRKYTPGGYGLTIRDWFANNTTEEMPEYLEPIQDENLIDYFAEIFVFRGEFNAKLIGKGGSLSEYFDDDKNIKLNYENLYSGNTDALIDLANDPNSNFIGRYQGTTIPYFKDANGRYISLDIVFNKDNYLHNMMMKFNEAILENKTSVNDIDKVLKVGESLGEEQIYRKLFNISYDSNKYAITEADEVTSKQAETKPDATTVIAAPGTSLSAGDKLPIITVNGKQYAYSQTIVVPILHSISYAEKQNGDKVDVPQDYEALAVFMNLNESNDPILYFNVPARTDGKEYVDIVGECLSDISKLNNPVKKEEDGDSKEVYYYTAEPYSGGALEKYTGNSVYVYRGTGKYSELVPEALKSDDGVSQVYLSGYTYTSITSTVTGKPLVEAILKMLDDKGIRTALTNNVDVNYHYLVDTLRTYKEGAKDKTKLFNIAKTKDNCFAIVNFPFMSDMISSASPNTIDVSAFTMPKEIDGASWGAYFTSLVFSDGTLKETVPSAACVSNNFMDKYGARLPYDIVAGPKYGRIIADGLVGPDYNYGRSDLDILEPYGVNAIIYVPRKGTYINSNQTAKQIPVSGLSKIHIRELVTYIQDEIQSLLESYQWDKNTSSLRDTIKAKADAILENIKNNDGVYAYLNTCDETNNTAEVIDNEMIILDTEIEPARGAGKMVNRLTIRRTGGITSNTL